MRRAFRVEGKGETFQATVCAVWHVWKTEHSSGPEHPVRELGRGRRGLLWEPSEAVTKERDDRPSCVLERSLFQTLPVPTQAAPPILTQTLSTIAL